MTNGFGADVGAVAEGQRLYKLLNTADTKHCSVNDLRVAAAKQRRYSTVLERILTPHSYSALTEPRDQQQPVQSVNEGVLLLSKQGSQ